MKRLGSFSPLILLICLAFAACGPGMEITATGTMVPPSPRSSANPTRPFLPGATPTASPASIASTTEIGPFHPVRLDEDLPPDLVRILHISDDGTLWLESEGGILRIVDETWEVVLSSIPGNLIGMDRAKRIWISDPDGRSISCWDGTGWIPYAEEAGWVPLQRYSSIRLAPVQDDFERIWIVTSEDLRLFDGQRWERFPPVALGLPQALETEGDASLRLYLSYLESNQQLWLGTCNMTGAGPFGGNGVRRYDGFNWQEVSVEFSSGCTEVIQEADDGSIWIGLDGDLWRYDPGTGTQIEIAAPPSPFEGNSFFSGVKNITLDLENDPWADLLLCGAGGCGFGTILFHLDQNEWIEIIREDFYDHDLFIDRSGAAWLLTPGGIYEIVGNQPRLFMELPIIPNSMRESHEGQIWFLVARDNANELWTFNANQSD